MRLKLLIKRQDVHQIGKLHWAGKKGNEASLFAHLRGLKHYFVLLPGQEVNVQIAKLLTKLSDSGLL